MDKSTHYPGGKEYTATAITPAEMIKEGMLVLDRKTGEWYDPEVKFQELLQEPWFQAQMVRMRMRDQGGKQIQKHFGVEE